ncbi:hypothetical protein PoB_003984800 [Plakobranchus ocellatus]|uniref:Uncharacterized protein n=1 Tax=Plakobranchus ocellatus TaxID=259542 RepID=A0AAV4B1B1_9GAST|nr:hypothetical protein PoB_003984800 [Plakobranchus ocellatus]
MNFIEILNSWIIGKGESNFTRWTENRFVWKSMIAMSIPDAAPTADDRRPVTGLKPITTGEKVSPDLRVTMAFLEPTHHSCPYWSPCTQTDLTTVGRRVSILSRT